MIVLRHCTLTVWKFTEKPICSTTYYGPFAFKLRVLLAFPMAKIIIDVATGMLYANPCYADWVINTCFSSIIEVAVNHLPCVYRRAAAPTHPEL
jgi:hypothetical protein